MKVKLPKKWKGRHLGGLICLGLGTALALAPGGGLVAAAILYAAGAGLIFT